MKLPWYTMLVLQLINWALLFAVIVVPQPYKWPLVGVQFTILALQIALFIWGRNGHRNY